MLVAWYPLNGDLKDISGNHYDLNTNYLYGDVNQDGKIDSTDSSLVLDYFNGNATLTDNQRALADVNQDGNINSRDSKEILNYINGINTDTLVGKLSNIQRFEPVWGEGKTGRYSLEFTGNEDMLYIENFLKSKEISISFWFCPLRKQDTTQWIVRIGDSTMSNLPLGIYINNLLRTESFGKTFAQEVELNKWIHITITASGSLTSTYINGKLVSTFSYNNSFNYTGDLTIGGRFSSNITKGQIYPLKGRLNNLKIYDHCLSKEEAYQDYLSPMLHYTFENPYAEETENLQSKVGVDNATLGEDSKGTYFIKNLSSAWHYGLHLNETEVLGGNYYTWSIDINPEIDINKSWYDIDPSKYIMSGGNNIGTKIHYFDFNLWKQDGDRSNNDNGFRTIDQYSGKIPKNTWTRVWVTIYVLPETGKGLLAHNFTVPQQGTEATVKIYYRNSMLEKKDHMTPYTRNRREGQLVRDVSGQGNDGTMCYRREEIPFVQTSMPNGIFTRSNYNGVSNMSSTLGYLKHDPKYFYLGSIISYEFDIKLENIVKKTENGIPYCDLGGATVRTDGTQYWSTSGSNAGGGPIQVTRITNRINNFTNGTYHVTIEKKITDPDSILNAKAYHFNFVPGYITGKVTISNLHFYYQNLDTSTLGITDRGCAIGTHSTHFNGKNWIDCGKVVPDELDSYTLSVWAYKSDWTTPNKLNSTLVGNINGGGFGLKFSGSTKVLNLTTYYKDIGYGDDSFRTSIDVTTLSQGWHLFTGIADKNRKALYIDGELYTESVHNSNKLISMGGAKNNSILVGREYDNVSTSHNIENIYLDSIRLYPVALTEDEVKALYRTKAKIDKDSNSYTNQLVETKNENIAKLSKYDDSFEPKTISDNYFTNGIYISALTTGSEKYTLEHKDGIYKVTITNTTTPRGINTGIYFRFIENKGTLISTPIPGKKYKASMWFKVSRSGKWAASAECLNPSQDAKYIEGNKWIRYEGLALAKNASTAFIFYYQNGSLQPNDTIEVRDFEFYRIDDDLLPIEKDTDPKVTKKAQVKGFELNEIDYDRLTKRQNIIEKDGAKWVEVFYHNTNNNTEWFANEAEALHCTSEYKYSRLDCLEQYRQSDGKLEFLLEYPEIPDQFNRWKQTDNPVTTEEIIGSVIAPVNGYEAIHIDWSNGFGGLLKSNQPCTLLDGTTNNKNWFYAIGSYGTHDLESSSWTGKLPGQCQDSSLPGYSSSNPAHEVRLYARISDEQINLGPTIINKYGAQWLEVFYHNNHSGTALFSNKEEAMHTIGNKDKYSILDCLEQYRGKDNKFEFLLEYPIDFPNTYNRWKQTDNPAEVKETNIIDEIGGGGGLDTSTVFPNAKGYEPIHIDMDGNSGNQQRWGGLLLSSRPETLIDGSVGSDHWWWSIGSMVSYTEEGKTGIPAIEFSNNIDHAVCQNDIHLYVRIDNINNRQQIFKLLKTGTIKTKEIKEI